MRTILITGATGGIGSYLTKEYIQNGDYVIAIHNHKNEEILNNWLLDFKINKEQIKFVACDLLNDDEVENILPEILSEYKIDVLINNAGVTSDSTFIKMKRDNWNKVIKLNLLSIFTITQFVVEQMITNRQGCIINISSINGLKGQFGQTNYSASKAGIIGFTKALALELANKNIRVNAIAPGYTQTPMLDSIPENILESIKLAIPTRKLVAPAEIAKTALFISSELPSLTGQVISVNGGQYM
jgi:acetoacetyl-CoA reductase